jgi:CheY-like chemotaxis protein
MSMQDRSPEHPDTSILYGRRILILDDELLVALETKALVWRAGGTVVGPYARVHAALEALQTHPVDGAILDINVAGMQSFVVADALMARNVPFVFCTGYGHDVVPPRFRSVAVVEKPLVPEVLVAALAEAFRAATAQAEP